MSDLTLVEFLLARIAEDEAYARMAFADHNENGPKWSEIWSGTVELGGTGQELLGCNDSGVSRHIERWDPARVLAECKAKRRILGWYVAADREAQDSSAHAAEAQALGDCMRAFAALHADHEAYRPEWKP